VRVCEVDVPALKVLCIRRHVKKVVERGREGESAATDENDETLRLSTGVVGDDPGHRFWLLILSCPR
jgi:hypothetical protein